MNGSQGRFVSDRVAKLRGTTYRNSSRDHCLYVPFPLVKPSPCLAILGGNGKTTEWEGLVVALPQLESREIEVIRRPEIAAALRIVGRLGGKVVSNCQKMHFIRELSCLMPTDAPFTDLPVKAVTMVCDEVLRDLKKASPRSKLLEAQIQATEERLVQTASLWSPPTIATIAVPKHLRENWQLLINWSKWIAETGDLGELAQKFYRHSLGAASLLIKKRQIDAFRNKLRYLNLPASARDIWPG